MPEFFEHDLDRGRDLDPPGVRVYADRRLPRPHLRLLGPVLVRRQRSHRQKEAEVKYITLIRG